MKYHKDSPIAIAIKKEIALLTIEHNQAIKQLTKRLTKTFNKEIANIHLANDRATTLLEKSHAKTLLNTQEVISLEMKSALRDLRKLMNSENSQLQQEIRSLKNGIQRTKHNHEAELTRYAIKTAKAKGKSSADAIRSLKPTLSMPSMSAVNTLSAEFIKAYYHYLYKAFPLWNQCYDFYVHEYQFMHYELTHTPSNIDYLNSIYDNKSNSFENFRLTEPEDYNGHDLPVIFSFATLKHYFNQRGFKLPPKTDLSGMGLHKITVHDPYCSDTSSPKLFVSRQDMVTVPQHIPVINTFQTDQYIDYTLPENDHPDFSKPIIPSRPADKHWIRRYMMMTHPIIRQMALKVTPANFSEGELHFLKRLESRRKYENAPHPEDYDFPDGKNNSKDQILPFMEYIIERINK